MKDFNRGLLLHLTDRSQGLLFNKLAFFRIDLENGHKEIIAKLPVAGVKGILGNCRLATKLLRLEPKCLGQLDENRFVVCLMNKFWLLNVKACKVETLSSVRQGYTVLNFCEMDGSLYWGDYGLNANHDEINVYRLDRSLRMKVAYTFPKGSVRHIHNIIKTDDGFIVFCGDNEKGAGIYRSNKDWTVVKPWKTGEQNYRAVVGFPYNGGLLYATDSVETENHLRLIDACGNEKELMVMNGSCIYGGETKGYFLFSTTVEPPEGGGMIGMLSRKLGGGIKSDEVFIVAVSKQDLSARIVAKFKKDRWPYKLMQYGQAMFAGGQETAVDGVWCYPMSCKKYDGKSLFIRFEE